MATLDQCKRFIREAIEVENETGSSRLLAVDVGQRMMDRENDEEVFRKSLLSFLQSCRDYGLIDHGIGDRDFTITKKGRELAKSP